MQQTPLTKSKILVHPLISPQNNITFAAMPQTEFEPVIGLEIHAQLQTASKMFCGDANVFGDEPNSHVSTISLAHPGTLPVLNKKAIHLAVKLGLALHCKINSPNYFDRKNYFYPDLPKGYQISQQAIPICSEGYIPIVVEGKEKHIRLNRIHLEEDAGKSIHDADPLFTNIDLNRAGVPLVEMVTEPVISSAEEAYQCLSMVRRILRHLQVCDGNMEEGSLRCDANISVREKGSLQLGTKVEIKNLNSIRNLKRSLTFETKRLVQLLSSGEEVQQETRGFDAVSGTTYSQRTKEEANDYRYFPDPDLPPVVISEEAIAAIQKEITTLPHETEKEMVAKYHVSPEAASIICEDDILLRYFEEIKNKSSHLQAVTNWLIGPVKSFFNENPSNTEAISTKKILSLANLTGEGHVAFATAVARIFPEVVHSDEDAMQIAKRLNLIQNNDSDFLNDCVEKALNNLPDKVLEYKKGKKNLIGLFAGEVKKISKGKADMKAALSIIQEKLNNA